jgi:hypothetical protein
VFCIQNEIVAGIADLDPKKGTGTHLAIFRTAKQCQIYIKTGDIKETPQKIMADGYPNIKETSQKIMADGYPYPQHKTNVSTTPPPLPGILDTTHQVSHVQMVSKAF